MRNEYGLDVSYFDSILGRMLRDIDRYTPDEFARQCARMAATADSKVMAEPEFARTITRADIPESLVREIQAEGLEKQADEWHDEGSSRDWSGWDVEQDLRDEAAKLREQKDEHR